MKKMYSVVVGVIIFLLFTTVFSFASEVVMAEYGPGEFAVKGQIKQALDNIVNQYTGKNVEISIVGSADMVGKSSENDDLAAKRARNAFKYLEDKLPMANFLDWSEGDSANVRKIQITVREKGILLFLKDNLIFLPTFILLLFPLYKLILYKRKKAVVTTESKVDVTVDGINYQVSLIFKNGEWFSPFCVASGSKIHHKDKGWIINNSLKACLRKDVFAAQKEALVKSGEIKIK